MLENVILIFASMFYLLVNTLKPVAFMSRKDFSKYCFFFSQAVSSFVSLFGSDAVVWTRKNNLTTEFISVHVVMMWR